MTRDRALTLASDWIYAPEHDRVTQRALGLIAAGCMVLLYAAHRLARS